jgi:hypothetical protein
MFDDNVVAFMTNAFSQVVAFVVVDERQKNDELLSTDATGDIAFSPAFLDYRGQTQDDFITSRMTVSIID